MKKEDQATYARFVVAASSLMRNNSFHTIVEGLIEALEDHRDNSFRRKHDQISRDAITRRIDQLREIK